MTVSKATLMVIKFATLVVLIREAYLGFEMNYLNFSSDFTGKGGAIHARRIAHLARGRCENTKTIASLLAQGAVKNNDTLFISRAVAKTIKLFATHGGQSE